MLRKEIGTFITYNPDAVSVKKDYLRSFAGFEMQKKFSSATVTVASVTVQGRLVYRHDRMDTSSDPMGMSADEPTGNLDKQTGDGVFSLFLNLVKEQNIGFVLTTHNLELAGRCDRTIVLEDGKIIS